MAGDPEGGDAQGGSGIAWAIVGTLVSGVLVWGGIGYLIDQWLGTDSVFLATGLIVGAGVAMYLIIVRYGKS
jgi:F0F1-type ATP synthase assembly protein I